MSSMSGTEYVETRVDTALHRLARRSRLLLACSLSCHLLMYATAAAGTVLATLGYSKWVTVTVMVTTLMTKWLHTFRIDDQRIATRKALGALGAAKLRWQGLPREAKERQGPLDQLLNAVETALEATLPPPEADVDVVGKQADGDTAPAPPPE